LFFLCTGAVIFDPLAAALGKVDIRELLPADFEPTTSNPSLRVLARSADAVSCHQTSTCNLGVAADSNFELTFDDYSHRLVGVMVLVDRRICGNVSV
jgi:hypothetical protein